MSMRHYYNYKTGESGYIDVEDNKPAVDLSRINGYEVDPTYHFGNFIVHTIIAAVIGGIAGAITGNTVIGILAGIASLVICIVIHLAKEGELFTEAVDRSRIVKHIIGYIATIGVSIGANAIIHSIFGLGVTVITAIVTIIIDILIIRKIDEFQVY